MNDIVKHAKNVLSLVDFNAFKTYLTGKLKTYANDISSIIAKAMGRGAGTFTSKQIKKILKTNWSGKLYSDRVWGNTARMKAKIEKEVMNVVLEVQDMETAIANIQRRFEVSYSEAKRLITTETNFAMNQGRMYQAKEQGYTHYKYTAIVDSRTTDVCLAQNGKIYAFEEAVVGYNFPPLLPNCRSTITPLRLDKR